MNNTHRDLLERAVADLRHAYLNLIRPEDSASWDITQRTRFAQGLLAPQIVRLEQVLNETQWSPEQTVALGRFLDHAEEVLSDAGLAPPKNTP